MNVRLERLRLFFRRERLLLEELSDELDLEDLLDRLLFDRLLLDLLRFDRLPFDLLLFDLLRERLFDRLALLDSLLLLVLRLLFELFLDSFRCCRLGLLGDLLLDGEREGERAEDTSELRNCCGGPRPRQRRSLLP